MPTIDIALRVLEPTGTAVVRASVYPSEISDLLGRAYHSVEEALSHQGVSPTGPPFARYHHREGDFEVEAGFPVGRDVAPSGDVVASSLPGGTVAVATFVGSYDRVGAAYRELREWVDARGGRPQGEPWEVYLTDPSASPDPSQWRTEIVLPFVVGA